MSLSPSAPPNDSKTQRRLERRIAEQRGRIDSMHRQQRRRRLVVGLLIVVPIIVLLAIALLISGVLAPPVAAQGHPVPIEGNRTHFPQGTNIAYRNRPPSSGDHYDNTAGYGVFSDRPWPTGNWVHNLEHGAIVVLYRPDLCDSACVSVLQSAYNDAPNSAVFPQEKKMIVQPYTDMDNAITTVAWGWEDDMAQPDEQRILAFYRAHVDRGPEVAA
jgi:hypothetical protein